MKAYSLDLRLRVVAYFDLGNTLEDTAETFAVSQSFVRSMLRLQKQTGSLESKPHGGGHPLAFKEESAVLLRQLNEQYFDLPLEELAIKVVEAGGPKVDSSTISRQFKRMDITRKKNSSSR